MSLWLRRFVTNEADCVFDLMLPCFHLKVKSSLFVPACLLDFLQQSLSVGDIALSSVGPVQLQPLLFSLRVLQHSLPPQALLGLHAKIIHCVLLCLSSTSTSFACEHEQQWRGLEVFFAPLCSPNEMFSIFTPGGCVIRQKVLRITQMLRRTCGRWEGLRKGRNTLGFDCR